MGKLGSLGESDKIIEYLFDYFGPGVAAIPASLKGKIGGSTQAGGKLISNIKQDNMRKKPIEIWGYEGFAAVRPVRETLCGLALAHKVVHCAKGSQNLKKLLAKAGKADLPFMEDPNTNTKLWGTADIVKYLSTTYTTKWRGHSDKRERMRGDENEEETGKRRGMVGWRDRDVH
jgi:Glutathione S-transferase, N-terminal domain